MMKVLVVARGERVKTLLLQHLQPIGFELLHLQDPVKVMERLEEIAADLILVDAGDFPRHWKPMVKLLREKKSKEEAVFILLSPPDLPIEDAVKATHLGVNGLINSKLEDRQEIYRLEQLFRRYKAVKDLRRFHRLVPAAVDRLGLAFTHPRTLALVTGSLEDISIQGVSFLPDNPELVADLNQGLDIPLCSLRIGDEVISVLCRITRKGKDLGLQFRSFETGGHHKLFQYIHNNAERQLKTALKGSGREKAAPPAEPA